MLGIVLSLSSLPTVARYFPDGLRPVMSENTELLQSLLQEICSHLADLVCRLEDVVTAIRDEGPRAPMTRPVPDYDRGLAYRQLDEWMSGK